MAPLKCKETFSGRGSGWLLPPPALGLSASGFEPSVIATYHPPSPQSSFFHNSQPGKRVCLLTVGRCRLVLLISRVRFRAPQCDVSSVHTTHGVNSCIVQPHNKVLSARLTPASKFEGGKSPPQSCRHLIVNSSVTVLDRSITNSRRQLCAILATSYKHFCFKT